MDSILKAVNIITDSVKPFYGTRNYLSTGDLNISKINHLETVSFDSKPSRANLNVKEGDIILARMQGTVKSMIITEPFNDLIVSTGFMVLRPKEDVLDRYLFHIFKSGIFQKDKDKLCSGATQKAINNSNFKKIKIPLPPLSTQKRIAEILDNAASLRDKSQQLLTEYDELAQSIFLDMFGDPATNPKNFPIRCLKDFYINKKTGVKCGPFGGALKKHEYVDSGVAVWNMDNISKNGELKEKINLWIDENKYKKLKSYLVKNDDIIISRAGTVGKMCVIKTDFDESIISTNLIRLRLDKKLLLPLFFTLMMTYFKERVGRLKTGGENTFTHMNTGILNNIFFPYPDIELQNQFAEKIALIEQQKDLAKQELQESEDLFQALLQRAFKGELV